MPPYDPLTGDVLQAARDWALFLDVDGTMLHIAETPDSVEVGAHLREALGRLAPALDGALALISGRRIADLDRLFAPLKLPAAGLHGLERRSADGRVHHVSDGAVLDELRAPLRDFADAHRGVLVEDKERTIAVHYRRAPEAEVQVRRLVERLTADLHDRLRVLEGKMVIEVKPRLADKGAAIVAFMHEAPFAGRRPVFVGDDVTDEDGFGVVNNLGGHSIRVGDGRATAAAYRLSGVEGVLDWLTGLHDLIERSAEGRQGA